MTIHPATLAAIRADALAIREATGDDDVAQADTLEAATDAMEMLDALVEAAQHADALSAATRERAQRLGERGRAFAERAKGYRRGALALLRAMDLPKVVRPGATLSIRSGSL